MQIKLVKIGTDFHNANLLMIPKRINKTFNYVCIRAGNTLRDIYRT